MASQKDQDQRLAPTLRFPEFRDAEAWQTKPLSALAKRQSKRNSDHEISRVLTNSAEFGVINQRDYFEKDIATQGNLDSYFVVEHGDYVYNPRISNAAPVGPIGKNKVGTGVMSPLYTVFRFSFDDNSFYEHYFRSTCWHGYLRHASNSGARHDRMAISNDAFIEMPLPSPCAAEQQKIADCLSSLDAVIAAEGERLELLRTHRVGLMQALFPAEGQINPRFRFPDLQDAVEWAKVNLSEVAFFQEGPGIMAVDFRDEGIPLVRLSGVSGTSVTLAGCNYLDPTKVSQKWSHFCLDLDDLVISTSATFGLVASVTEETAGAVFYTGLIRFRPRSERLVSSYLKTFLGSEPFARQVDGAAVGGGIKHFGPTHLKQMTIPLPSMAEQKLVADCLNAVEDLIEKVTQRLEAFNAHKTGLMQQLFPSPDEATA